MPDTPSPKQRVQPAPLAVPTDQPFKNDLLARRQHVLDLTALLFGISGPCTLAIDGDWGTGKSTFVRMWEKHLRKVGFAAISFNAWDSDYCNDPFTALTEELIQGIESCGDVSDDGQKLQRFKDFAPKIALLVTAQVARLGILASTGLNIDVEKALSKLLESDEGERSSAYKATKQHFEQFRAQLEDLARTVADKRKGKPLVVFVDELDRCRPSYAVEFLENAKHLFSVDHIIFVLAINRAELGHAVSAIYGQEFDGSMYLKRFIDLDLKLEEPNRGDFIKAHLDALGIEERLRQIAKKGEFDDLSVVSKILYGYLGMPQISLRTISQSLHRLGVVLAIQGVSTQAGALGAVVLLILRAVDLNVYNQVLGGEIDDKTLCDKFNTQAGYATDPFDNSPAIFEATLTVGIWEMGRGSRPSDSAIESPLLKHYAEIIRSNDSVSVDGQHRVRHAEYVIEFAERLSTGVWFDRVGFRESARLLDLMPN